MIQLSEFFQYSFVLILKRKCLVGASRVRFGESGTPSTIIYRRWSSRRYELGYHASVELSNNFVVGQVVILDLTGRMHYRTTKGFFWKQRLAKSTAGLVCV